jgi:hypothetical protein
VTVLSVVPGEEVTQTEGLARARRSVFIARTKAIREELRESGGTLEWLNVDRHPLEDQERIGIRLGCLISP